MPTLFIESAGLRTLEPDSPSLSLASPLVRVWPRAPGSAGRSPPPHVADLRAGIGPIPGAYFGNGGNCSMQLRRRV